MAGTIPSARPPTRHDARPAFAAPVRAQSAPRARPEPPVTARMEPPGTTRPEPPGTALPPHPDPYAHPASRAELYAAAATDGQVASRLVEYETALETERRRASQAIAACHASQRRASESEERLRMTQSQLYLVHTQRGSLAASLDESLRNLGQAHSELHGHRLRQLGQPAINARSGALRGGGFGGFGAGVSAGLAGTLQPGSWGLLQELHQLHLKLHDGKGPLMGAPPPTAP